MLKNPNNGRTLRYKDKNSYGRYKEAQCRVTSTIIPWELAAENGLFQPILIVVQKSVLVQVLLDVLDLLQCLPKATQISGRAPKPFRT